MKKGNIKHLMKKNPDAAIDKFIRLCGKLELKPEAQDKLLSMFKDAFLPDASIRIEIDWDKVHPLTNEEMIPYDSLPEPVNASDLLNQVIYIKLNGGLASNMGCDFPKSLVKCADDLTFFDIICEQIKDINKTYNVNVPLILMNSFITDEQMKPHIENIKDLEIYTFLQNRFPRIFEKTWEPIPDSPEFPNSGWNPPGHADVYNCLRDSGLLDKFIRQGKKYMMVSNIDNVGARLDLKILNKVISEQIPYACEIVDRHPDEWKGGLPIIYENHKKLLETVQVPPNHMDEFTSIPYFHTNNIWVNLEKLKESLDNGTLQEDVMKTHGLFNGKPVIQLESASGSVIQSFPEAIVIKVHRRRFIPVKASNELLLMRADLFIKKENAEFRINPKRTVSGFPHITLSQEFQRVVDFDQRIPHPPSIYNLVSLNVDGDVWFGKDVVLEGNVTIYCPKNEKFVIPDGYHIKNREITSVLQLK